MEPLTYTKEREAEIRLSMNADYDYGDVERISGEGQELLTELDATREALQQAEALFRCYHCGFESADPAECEAHFGDRDDSAPLCIAWTEMTKDERLTEYQSTTRELNGQRDENAAQRVAIEGLEFRVEGQLSEIHSFKPFRTCNSIQQVFNVYDSMEGRALAAEATIQRERELADQLAEALETNLVFVDPGTNAAARIRAALAQHAAAGSGK